MYIEVHESLNHHQISNGRERFVVEGLISGYLLFSGRECQLENRSRR